VGAVGKAAGAAVVLGTALAAAGTAHTAWNLRELRTPPASPLPCDEPVSVLLPARDEAARIAPCVASLLSQQGVPDLEVLVLDDGSSDGTADVVRSAAHGDPRLRVVDGGHAPLPAGWLGKPWACARLAEQARGRVLVFVDADVVLAPQAVAATVALLRSSGLDLVCPYPRQLAETPAERLVQPLLQWSWLTTLPLAIAETSSRPSMAAANGQLLAVDAAAYARAGGHGAVRGEVLDDVALLRAVMRSGGHGGVADGTNVATCRMYDSPEALVEGYTKSLWSAFGSRPAAAAVMGGLLLAYALPPAAAVLARTPRTRAVGAAGYAAGVLGRLLVARRTGQRAWPDALVHPASVAALAALTAESWRRHDRAALRWKGRTLPGPTGR
jgi:hypothetical protein